ncbi:MAG: hypothetical protein AAF438_00260 [Pseudomonadota bacterium]
MGRKTTAVLGGVMSMLLMNLGFAWDSNKNITVTTSSDPGKDYETVNGNVTVREGVQLDSSSEVSTVNGSIRIGESAVVGEVDTVNGSVKLGDFAKAESVNTVNGSIRMAEGVEIRGDVETVNGSLRLNSSGVVGGGMENVNGSIQIRGGRVDGSLVTYTGDILITEGGSVAGGLTVKKSRKSGWKWGDRKDPKIIIGPNSSIAGELVFERDVKLYVHDSASVGRITGAEPISFSDDEP